MILMGIFKMTANIILFHAHIRRTVYILYYILKVIDLNFYWKLAFKRIRRFYFRVAVLECYWMVTKNDKKTDFS